MPASAEATSTIETKVSSGHDDMQIEDDNMQLENFSAPVELSEEAKAAKANLAQKLGIGTAVSSSTSSLNDTQDTSNAATMDIVGEGSHTLKLVAFGFRLISGLAYLDKLASMISMGMSKAKIQEMREKFKKKKTDTDSTAPLPGTATLAKATMDATSKIIARERALMDRKSVLQAPKQKVRKHNSSGERLT